jgi:hypothetical protein
VAGPKSLHVGGGIQRGKAAYILAADYLQVGKVVPLIVDSVAVPRCLKRVQSISHRAVTECVEVDLHA